MHRGSLANGVATATGVSIALAALVAALAAFFVLSAKSVEAQQTSLEVKPITVDFGDQAVGLNSEPVSVTITNTGSTPLIINGATAGADAGALKIVDPITGLLVDTITGLNIPGNTQKTLELVLNPTAGGPIEATLNLIDSTTTTVLQTVPVTGTGQQCTISGTPNDDPALVGTPGNDVICGLAGNDTIDATQGGKDIVFGNEGNDTINIKDGKRRDKADGGVGQDLCQKDRKDKAKSCGKKNGK